MSKIKKLIADLQRMRSETMEIRGRMAAYVNDLLDKKPPLRMPGDKRAVVDFVMDEFGKLAAQIPSVSRFREADNLCVYANELFLLMTRFVPSSDALTEQQRSVVETLGTYIDKTEELPRGIDNLFVPGENGAAPVVNASDVLRLTDMMESITDPDHRCMFAEGFLHYKDKLSCLTFDAEAALQAFVGDDMERLLASGDDMTEDEANGLEFYADLCRYIPCDRLTGIVSRLPSLGRNNVSYYALGSLLALKAEVPDELIRQLAYDDEYAYIAKLELDKAGMGDRFPENRSDPIVLHKSDLVHWLTYPTELGKKPDEIKFYTTVDAPDGKVYVYLFKSGSDTLTEDLKGQWLIGWSDDENGAFSEFRTFASCDRGTPEKTAEYIKSCLR